MPNRNGQFTLGETLAGVAVLAVACALVLPFVRGCSGDSPPPRPLSDPEGPDVNNAVVKRQQQLIDGYRAAAQGSADKILGVIGEVRGVEELADVEQVRKLRVEVVGALEATHSLGDSLLTVRRELKHASYAYQCAARGFRNRAEDYADGEFKARCLAWAAHYDALAAACPGQQQRVERFLDQVEPTVGFVRETKRLLDDYHLFLSTYVEAEPPRSEVEEYLEALRNFAQKFRTFERESELFAGRGPFYQAAR